MPQEQYFALTLVAICEMRSRDHLHATVTRDHPEALRVQGQRIEVTIKDQENLVQLGALIGMISQKASLNQVRGLWLARGWRRDGLRRGPMMRGRPVHTTYEAQRKQGRSNPVRHARGAHKGIVTPSARNFPASSNWRELEAGCGRFMENSTAEPRPFRVLGLQQIALGQAAPGKLQHLWCELFGVPKTGHYRSEAENVDEDILTLGWGAQAVEVDLMSPVDPDARPRVDQPTLHHVGIWIDDLPAAYRWLEAQGLRFAPGGIRPGAAGHDVCFVHPKANDDFPFCAQGMLLELVQAPPELISAYEQQAR